MQRRRRDDPNALAEKVRATKKGHENAIPSMELERKKSTHRSGSTFHYKLGRLAGTLAFFGRRRCRGESSMVTLECARGGEQFCGHPTSKQAHLGDGDRGERGEKSVSAYV